jgi:tetratricopeptide (TPR) repeat protein
LLAACEAEALHQRHASYFLAFGAPPDAELVDVGRFIFPAGFPAELLDQLEREQDNLRSALRWWIETGDAERAVKQADVLFPVWFRRASATEGHAWLEEILAIPSALGTPGIRRRALPILARLASHDGEYAVALEACEEMLAAQRSVGDRLGAAYALAEIANVHYLRAEYTAAWASLDASWAEASDVGDRQFESLSRNYGAMLALCEGRYDLARTLATAAQTGFDSDNEPLASAYSQMTLGYVDREEGRYEEANARFLNGLQVALDCGDRTLLAHFLEGFSGLACALGQHRRAVRLGGAAAALREAAGAPLSPAWQHLAQRWLAISRQALGEETASAAWAAGQSLPMERALEEAEDTRRGEVR